MLMINTPTNKPSVSAVLFGFHGINLFKNLVSPELLQILENFHFSFSTSSILISLFTSRKRVKAFFFHLALLKNSESFFISHFTSRTSKTHSRWSLVGVMLATSILDCPKTAEVLFCEGFDKSILVCMLIVTDKVTDSKREDNHALVFKGKIRTSLNKVFYRVFFYWSALKMTYRQITCKSL